MQPPKPIYSYFTAACLALVTLVSFYVLRNYGPETAIRQFHRAAVSGDMEEINRLTIEGSQSPATLTLVNEVQRASQVTSGYRIVAMRRSTRAAVAAVEYPLPNGKTPSMAWYVQKPRETWCINATSTVAGLFRN